MQESRARICGSMTASAGATGESHVAWEHVDYEALWLETEGLNCEDALGYFELHLPYVCRDAYVARSTRPALIVRVRQGGFEYIFDAYTSLEASGAIPYSAID